MEHLVHNFLNGLPQHQNIFVLPIIVLGMLIIYPSKITYTLIRWYGSFIAGVPIYSYF